MSSREYPDRPLVGIGVVVLSPSGVLMIRRGKPPRVGGWSLPGGAQKVGETVADAARREVREETGLEVEVLGLVDVIDSINPDAKGAVQYHYTLVDFMARPIGGTLKSGGDAMDAQWIAYDALPELSLWSETERVIALAREMAAALPDELA